MVDTFILHNGRIIDPANGLDFVGDVFVQNGIISKVETAIVCNGVPEIDATGCLVVPGLIDCHVHCYEHVTPLGINPDDNCLSRGVTTIVDAGSSGHSTFPGLRKFIAERSNTRVLCFLHITPHGLASSGCATEGTGGELDSLNQVDTDSCERVIRENRDIIVGVKIRLTEKLANEGKNEQEAYRRALYVSTTHGPSFIFHGVSVEPSICFSAPGDLGCPRDLRKGDIYTHSFHWYNRSCIVDQSTRTIHQDVINARQRGVLFDVGHGKGSFSFEVAKICCDAQFWPDTISTDLHSQNYKGPVYDLTSVMSKFLNLGMPLNDVIKAVTYTPAKAIKMENKLGSLSVGREADITLLNLETTPREFEDSQSEFRMLDKWIKPVAVWKGGKPYPIKDL